MAPTSPPIVRRGGNTLNPAITLKYTPLLNNSMPITAATFLLAGHTKQPASTRLKMPIILDVLCDRPVAAFFDV